MSEYIVELDSKHSIVLKLAFAEEMRGGDFVRGEIVRCRDCDNAAHFYQWLTPSKRSSIETWTCRNMEGFEIDPDGFCAWGIRRVGE